MTLTPEQRGQWLADAHDTTQKWSHAADTAVPSSVLHARRVIRLLTAHDALAARVRELEARLAQAAPHICPDCGPFARVDEDGCCVVCGADTYFESDPYKTATRPPESPEAVAIHRIGADTLDAAAQAGERLWDALRKSVPTRGEAPKGGPR